MSVCLCVCGTEALYLPAGGENGPKWGIGAKMPLSNKSVNKCLLGNVMCQLVHLLSVSAVNLMLNFF